MNSPVLTVFARAHVVCHDVDKKFRWGKVEKYGVNFSDEIICGIAADTAVVDDLVNAMIPGNLCDGKLFHQRRTGKKDLSFDGILV